MTAVKQQFWIAALKVGNSAFSINDFSGIQNEDTQNTEVSGEIQASKKIIKEVRDNRFVLIYFEEGTIYPRPEVVYNRNLHGEEENPRTIDQIERDSQTFVLIDVETQHIFFSDFRKKGTLEHWLGEKIEETVLIKNIIDKEHFLSEIESVSTIYMCAEPTLFSNIGILGEALASDHHNYGVGISHIGLTINFEENNVPEKLKRMISRLFAQKDNNAIQKLEVSGRHDDKFERVFNGEGIVDKISIDATLGNDGLRDRDEVFSKLIFAITQ